MRLANIKIQNYRLLINADLKVDDNTTLIVGRNNTAKTSCVELIDKVLKNKVLSYDDYPLIKRKYAYVLLAQFMRNKLSFEKLCEKFPVTSIDFWIDYTLDDPNINLGALAPFIIDVDVDNTMAIIHVEYSIKISEESLRTMFESCFFENDNFVYKLEDVRDVCMANFSKIFGLNIYAVNPKDDKERQLKEHKELTNLFPFYAIPAERILGENGDHSSNSLGTLISSYFSVDIENLDPKVVDEVKELRKTVEEANIKIQRQSNELLGNIVNKAVGFGYPNAEELQLGVNTRLQIDDQIKDKTELTYTSTVIGESLPSSHNGLGYKNLIKIEFMLADFAEKIKRGNLACIPLLFIEEPESHMHPQMQQTFASYLEKFLGEISDVHIQTFLTSHSAHIANTIDFSQIRYAQKTVKGVIYKNLNTFAENNKANLDFIKKYLTLSRCDLFFADKVIFVEGASERLLLPDMIDKCNKEGLFNSKKYKLPAQYYALIEIGGAYANKFIPFVNFLGIPCLLLTDIDSMEDGRTKAIVSKGKTTSNATLKWWVRKMKGLPEEDTSKIDLSDVIALTYEQKTIEKCHVEFQVKENGLCGRSLEEAIKNVNRAYYGLTGSITEDDLEFTDKSKTDFALNLVCDNPEYVIPKYIKDGLIWLNEQNVLV